MRVKGGDGRLRTEWEHDDRFIVGIQVTVASQDKKETLHDDENGQPVATTAVMGTKGRKARNGKGETDALLDLLGTLVYWL